jgi:hypothetical protein
MENPIRTASVDAAKGIQSRYRQLSFSAYYVSVGDYLLEGKKLARLHGSSNASTSKSSTEAELLSNIGSSIEKGANCFMSPRFRLMDAPSASSVKPFVVTGANVGADLEGKLNVKSPELLPADSFVKRTDVSVPVKDPRGEQSLCLLVKELSAELRRRLLPSEYTD